MDNKELYEILQDYAESTRNDKDRAFKKLNEQPKQPSRAKSRSKSQIIFASMMCSVILALCIALPITFTTENAAEITYCAIEDLVYEDEVDIAIFQNQYNLNAMYPKREAVLIRSISSISDPNFKCALLGYFEFVEVMIDIDLTIVPKTHILQVYEKYFKLENSVQWEEYKIIYETVMNPKTGSYDMKIYFTDGSYDYFITAQSDGEIAPTNLLNILYN